MAYLKRPYLLNSYALFRAMISPALLQRGFSPHLQKFFSQRREVVHVGYKVTHRCVDTSTDMPCSEVAQASASSPMKGFQTDPKAKAVLKFAKLTDNATVPTRGSAKSAGYDLYSAYDYSLDPMDKVVVKTDIQISVPAGCYGRVAPRSGLAAKYFIDVGAGVVDEDYRGNVAVVLFNFGKEAFEVKKGDRIAQLICEKICYPELEECETLDETARGADGFGSTGRS